MDGGKQRFFVIAIEALINFFTNGALNALCAWLIHREGTVSCGAVNIFIDTCITCLFVSLCTSFFSAASAKRHIVLGALETYTIKKRSLFYKLTRRPLRLSLMLAFCAMLPLGILFGSFFSLLGIQAVAVSSFVIYKGIWGGLFGSFVCAAVIVRNQYA